MKYDISKVLANLRKKHDCRVNTVDKTIEILDKSVSSESTSDDENVVQTSNETIWVINHGLKLIFL